MAVSLLDDLEEASDAAALRAVIEREFQRLGFDFLGYLALHVPDAPDTPLSLISTYPQAWVRRYVEHGYANFDPVCLTAAQSTIPFAWTSRAAGRSSSIAQRRIFDEATEFGIKNGITVPIHGPSGALATLSGSADMPDREFRRLWRAHRDALHVLALHCHAAIEKRVLRVAPRLEGKLTGRERECLLWSARGKTAWETSEILGISESTIVFHLKNAMRKLGVRGKTHAVMKAIVNKVIFP